MQKYRVLLALGAMAFASAALAGQSSDEANKPHDYVSAMGSYVIPDSVRQDTWGAGAHLVFGIPLTKPLSLEINGFGTALSRSNQNASIHNSSHSDGQLGAGADLRYLFGDGRVQPFVLGGLGADWETYHYSRNADHWGPYVDLGVGVLARLTKHLSLRAEARYYGIYNSESYQPHALGDTRLNLGLQYALFREPPPPPPPTYPPTIENSTARPVPKLVPAPKCAAAPAGFKVDANGCIVAQTVVLRGVNFRFDRSSLTPAAEETLRRVVDDLKAQPGLRVEIIGNTDSIGSTQYNLGLSQRRADTVKQWLIDRGAKASRLTTKGLGESNPIASNHTRKGRAENRRVEFKITNAPDQIKVMQKAPTEASVTQAEQPTKKK